VSFANLTGWSALPLPLVDRAGRDVVVVVVKATFALEQGRVRLADEQRPVRTNDELHRPDEPLSSVRFPADGCVEKLGTDVVVVGDAVAPRPVETMDVVVRVRDLDAPLRVHGPRRFVRGAFGVVIGPASKVDRVPIVYENAYGGMSADQSVVELRNPSGVGVAVQSADLVDQRAPQIEHPARPHTNPSDRHAPMGYGALMSHWSPRRELCGTFDSAWQRTRMPLLPTDYDVRHGNVAHPTLQLAEPLAAGDPVHVLGMSPEPMSFAVPPWSITLQAIFETGDREVVRPPVDTLLLLPEEGLFEMTARAPFAIGRGQRILREVVVSADD
jgi:hypothetical protein